LYSEAVLIRGSPIVFDVAPKGYRKYQKYQKKTKGFFLGLRLRHGKKDQTRRRNTGMLNSKKLLHTTKKRGKLTRRKNKACVFYYEN